MLNYSIITANGKSCVTLFVPGAENPILTADDSNPGFENIVATLLDSDYSGVTPEEVADLFEPEAAAAANFARTSVSERISVKDGQVYFDNAPIDTGLTRMMIRLMDEGIGDWEGLALFFEKVQTNPNEHSRDQLFEWLRRHDVAINSEGDCIFYKGVRAQDGQYVSVHAGPAIVNGLEVNGNVPNNPGDLVEMDRSRVVHNPSQGCASGLHVANWRYAESWAQGAVLKVLVNPRDVVSVPTDCDWEKVRCSRYLVLEAIDAPVNTAYLPMDGIDVEDFEGDPADFDMDVSGGVGADATARMGMTKPGFVGQAGDLRDDFADGADAASAGTLTAPNETYKAGEQVVIGDSCYGPDQIDDGSDVPAGTVGTIISDVTVTGDTDRVNVNLTASDGENLDLCFYPDEIKGRVSAASADGRNHGKGGPTSLAAKGSGRNPAQDAKGKFSAGRPGSARDTSGRFA